MRVREFSTELGLPLPPEELFPFFADAGNLDVLTPPWLHFHIVRPPPIELRAGPLIAYELRVHGWPIRWRTRINEWQPPFRFVDEPLPGPYRQWIHEHTFDAPDGGTLARDCVRYAVPIDFLTPRWLVRSDVEKVLRSFALLEARRHCRQLYGLEKESLKSAF